MILSGCHRAALSRAALGLLSGCLRAALALLSGCSAADLHTQAFSAVRKPYRSFFSTSWWANQSHTPKEYLSRPSGA